MTENTSDKNYVIKDTPIWTQLIGGNDEDKIAIKNDLGFDMANIHDVDYDDLYLYLPLRVVIRGSDDCALTSKLIIILGDHKLITMQDQRKFPPFDSALAAIKRHPEFIENPKALLRLLLHVLNEETSRVIIMIGHLLEASSTQIARISGSFNASDKEVGIKDIEQIMVDLNNKEALISRCLESQLSLARAARYLDAEVTDSSDAELQSMVHSLREDIDDVKEHASFEHDKVRYLQNAVLASLNVKQNLIVKIFTIITAVFLPPTLVATFYGMNFAVMPELAWQHGFAMSIGLTLFSAIMPLVYIKKKGWLR